jgi:hypothetical protein
MGKVMMILSARCAGWPIDNKALSEPTFLSAPAVHATTGAPNTQTAPGGAESQQIPHACQPVVSGLASAAGVD